MKGGMNRATSPLPLSASREGKLPRTKTEVRVARCLERAFETEKLKAEATAAERLLTRRELAAGLKVSVRTVDEMVAAHEITALRPGGMLVRFYWPEVVRELMAAARDRLRGTGPESQISDLKFQSREKAQATQGTERTKGL